MLKVSDQKLKESYKKLEESYKAHLNIKIRYINWLELDYLSIRGTINCRGALEVLLNRIKDEKKIRGNFVASKICRTIRVKTKLTSEKLLVNTNQLVVFKLYGWRKLAKTLI